MDPYEWNAESLMHKHGQVAVIVHKDQLSRDEKDVVRAATAEPGTTILPVGNSHYVLFINEEPGDDEPVGDFEEEQELDKDPTVVDEDDEDGDEPTLSDLESLTVAQLKDLADKEALDVSDLKLKADLVGRLAAHFGVAV